jgi:DNA-binding NarL/FixJ family response regulator
VISVVLVDDQQLVRTGLHRILAEEEGFAVVAECRDGAEALVAVADAAPDVVLMDIRMRGMDGIEATRRLRQGDGPPVLVLTTFDDDEVLSGALEAGAAGFVLKEASAEQLIEATRAVAAGEPGSTPPSCPACSPPTGPRWCRGSGRAAAPPSSPIASSTFSARWPPVPRTPRSAVACS